MPAFPYEAESIDAPQEEQRHADAASRKSRVKSVHTCLLRREPSEALASEARVSISRRRQNAKASVQPIALSGVYQPVQEEGQRLMMPRRSAIVTASVRSLT